jgi:RsiW-degrading membrane proteinase PrsW (M82 family)
MPISDAVGNSGLDPNFAVSHFLLLFVALALFSSIVGVVLVSLVWLFCDADKYGQPGFIWVVVTLFFAYPLGLIIWLVMRASSKSPGSTFNH